MVALAPYNINDPRNLNELELDIHNLNSLKRADYDFIYRNVFKKYKQISTRNSPMDINK